MHSSHPQFQKPGPEVEARVTELLARLSLEQKLDLLSGSPEQGLTRAAPEAGVIAYRMSDGPVGVHWFCEASTTYPTSVGLAASFNRELLYEVGSAIGRDARARGIHILLAPGVNLYRMPVCGRNFEYFGEDPELAGDLAAAYIRGVQSQAVAATVKHFAINYQEFERHLVSSEVDARTLHELYLRPFEAAVKAGVGAVMTAYNLVNGVHCSESELLIRDILKERWGFDGLVMSDWVSVYSDVAAANAGLDLEMPTARWFDREHLLGPVQDGRIPLEVIDDKIRRLLRLGIAFGWYDHEQKDAAIPEEDPATAKVALEAARESIVLLKNEGSLLPLAAEQRFLVVGNAAHPAFIGGGGSAYNKPFHAVSVLEGLHTALGEGARVAHEVGVDPERALFLFAASEFTAPNGEPGLEGQYFDNASFSGEPFVTRVDRHVNQDWTWQAPAPGMKQKGISMRWRGSITAPRSGRYRLWVQCNHGSYTLRVGGQTLLAFEGLNLRRFPDDAVVSLDAGVSTEVVLEYVRPRDDDGIHLGWEPAEVLEELEARGLAAAREAEVVVACFGFSQKTESECDDREYALAPRVERYLAALAQVNPRLVLVLHAGGAVSAPWLSHVPALLHAFFPGQACGTAISEILLGRTNPSAKLPFTWEKRLEDRAEYSCYWDEDQDGRVTMSNGLLCGYRHFDHAGIEPLFPFGFGLSYSSFEYANLELDADELHAEDALTLSFDLTNTSPVAGAEVVQLYLSARAPRLPRPPKELVGYAKVTLAPGETRRVTLELLGSACRFYDPEAQAFVIEPGLFELLIGSSARDLHLRAEFRIVR